MNPVKVSIIVLIYNVEIYIERCARSLFEQTLDNLEFIFVNDYSPDESMIILNRVIKDYPQRSNQIKIINNPINLGSGNSRNIGIANATGEYVIHCDSDDWVELNMYEKMYQAALSQAADIVMCNHVLEKTDTSIISSHQCKLTDSRTFLYELYKDLTPGYLCTKLIRTRLIHDNKLMIPHDISIREDQVLFIQILYYANKIAYIDGPLYHYNKCNINSLLTSTCKKKDTADTRKGKLYIHEFLHSKNDKKLVLTCNYLLFTAKFDLLRNQQYDEWRKEFPESNAYIMQYSRWSLPVRIVLKLTSWGIFFPAKIIKRFFNAF